MPVGQEAPPPATEFVIRLRDADTGEVFAQEAETWYDLDDALMEAAQYRGHTMEAWTAPRAEVDPALPADVLPLDQDGRIAPPWDWFAWTHYSKPYLLRGAELGARMGFVEGWVVTRDGETIAGPFPDGDAPFEWLQTHQTQSWE